MYVNRELGEKIGKNLNKKEILAIVGPRQCGKTTLLKHIYEKLESAVFIDFEDRENLELFVEDEKAFAELYAKDNKYLFIDEFHYAQNGGKKLKFIYDNYPKTKILISGSSAPGITISGMKYLVGRVFVFHLYPFSFEEFLGYKNRRLYENLYIPRKESIMKYLNNPKHEFAKTSSAVIEKINRYYEEYVLFGGYPRVVLSEDIEEKRTVLENIYNTYFLREIKEILNLTEDFKLSKLIRALALQIGNIVSYNDLSVVSGFRYNDLLKHLNILEKTFICTRVEPFYSNKRLEIVKSPKIYFFDNGFRNQVIGDFRNLDRRTDSGKLNENFVATQLIQRNIKPNFWRSKSKAEVDFVLQKEDKVIPLEVKSLIPKKIFTKSLINFMKKYPSHTPTILSQNMWGKRRKDREEILYLPLSFVNALTDAL
ncbi:MAG: ATP-binding protein [Candidatus Altiarchaeales archaeon]|nr:ATP-binding protein [Candidatus Altiarchaeota archaeon]MBU4341937.1 ATP-binding protein [Candidatus Altiarchaeota archaeon]MBU4406531.1 ATP-binding protein [Candidatus Altiarchaeota archaeon]MCG2782322.1 ATP-binding protein [Candidatus Altiarchaeales archaeon]